METNTIMDESKKQHLHMLELRIMEACPAKDSFEQYLRVKNMSETERQMLRALLKERQYLLDAVFIGSPMEKERLRVVNDKLYELTRKLYAKTYNLYTSCLRSGYDPEFDDDIMFEGTLFYNVEEWSEDKSNKAVQENSMSVLPMDEDEMYGSDFVRMMGLITALQEKATPWRGACVLTLKSLDLTDNPGMTSEELGLNNFLDDGTSWDHQGRFPEICLCHAAYNLLCENLFSYQDVLRMNDFWCEVKVTHQLLTDLKGNRSSCIENRLHSRGDSAEKPQKSA